MEVLRPLSERPLTVLLQQAAEARCDGLVVVRDREGMRHGVWLEGGYAVGAHVAGRFDPLLELLRRRGVLGGEAHRACIEALYAATVRAGTLAMELGGVPPHEVRDALCAQLVGRLAALLTLARSEGHDGRLEPRPVPPNERCVRMPVGSLLRRAAHAHDDALGRDAARRKLRAAAKLLHPDRHGDLDPEQRQRLTDQLAQATAAYHGFT